MAPGIFRKEGEYWTVGYGGKSFCLKNTVGLGYLAHLLRHPAVEFHVLDLFGGIAGWRDEAEGSQSAEGLPRGAENLEKAGIHIGSLSDAGEMLDEQAKVAYKRRLCELRGELADAKKLGSVDRAEHVEVEIDALTRELSRAVGLGGRNRRAASASERARQSITKSIKSAIERIARSDATLGGIFSRSIKTGTFCCFQPDPDISVAWEFAGSLGEAVADPGSGGGLGAARADHAQAPRAPSLPRSSGNCVSEKPVNALLAIALDAHGGLDRWNEQKGLTARLSVSGPTWAIKGQPYLFNNIRIEMPLREQHMVTHLLGQGRKLVFDPDQVAVETERGEPLFKRPNRKGSFEGHSFETPWDELHATYFCSYALWTYLTIPFLYTYPGFSVEEISPWNENGEEWRRLKATFPDGVASHTKEQVSYFGPDGLLRRHQYTVDILGGAQGLNYASDYRNFGGIKVPTRRRIYRDDGSGHQGSSPVLISINISELAFVDG
jgi:hypothetical protein